MAHKMSFKIEEVPNHAGAIAEALRTARIRHPSDPYDAKKDIPRTARIQMLMLWDNQLEALASPMEGVTTLPRAFTIEFLWEQADEDAETAFEPTAPSF